MFCGDVVGKCLAVRGVGGLNGSEERLRVLVGQSASGEEGLEEGTVGVVVGRHYEARSRPVRLRSGGAQII